ncbi:MAG: outer membrane lipoprotein-sorting protein [Amphiplicatus sp.]|uniref:outer membrane lipoprotein-sorting protein n=1 Tax=Methylocystis sp. TaxID=1911079 RepID=UPI003D0E49BF
MPKPSLRLAIALALALFAAPAFAQSEAQKKGYEISARSDASDRGFGDSRVEATMILRNAAGQSTERALSFQTLEKENDDVGDKSLVVFKSPRDVEGTALLSHANILTPDDQWLYLPALKRVKRISSANKSGPFVGSEFAFEDFTATELKKYAYEWLREETVDGVVMDVVSRTPLYENSGYTKQIAWVDQDVFQVRKVEFYDRKAALLKTLWLEDYREYDGVWRSHKFRMVNHQSGKETDLVYGDFAFKTGFGPSDFTPAVLERIR